MSKIKCVFQIARYVTTKYFNKTWKNISLLVGKVRVVSSNSRAENKNNSTCVYLKASFFNCFCKRGLEISTEVNRRIFLIAIKLWSVQLNLQQINQSILSAGKYEIQCPVHVPLYTKLDVNSY